MIKMIDLKIVWQHGRSGAILADLGLESLRNSLPGIRIANKEAKSMRERMQRAKHAGGAALLLCALSGSVLVVGAREAGKRAADFVAKAAPHKRVAPAHPAAPTAEKTAAGLVLDISGDWSVSNGQQSKELARGSVLPDGWKLMRRSAAGTLTAVLLDGRTLKCPGSDLCACALTASSGAGPAGNFWRVTTQLFSSRMRGFIQPISRATAQAGQQPLIDAVVRLDGDRVDLAPVFAGSNARSLTVRFQPLDSGFAGSTGLAPVALTIGAGERLTPSVSGMDDGLYRMIVLDADGEPSGEDAFVLVSSRERYDNNLASFRLAADQAEKLKPDIGTQALRDFLRRYMYAMSRAAS